ncbi:MAG: YceK/YidQ family lipoprotein [Elusimicrobia bacterium]|nr:YceK/YidQ family lipoprotein [Elusimicrobiota bacterium]
MADVTKTGVELGGLSPMTLVVVPFAAIDTVLSACADTLLLPIDLSMRYPVPKPTARPCHVCCPRESHYIANEDRPRAGTVRGGRIKWDYEDVPQH